ncbi:hypothetical protein LTR15_006211 [Elasticomyces elasticus]|nr:hypothetical protein LTR15_006211 [Elasticomyces elasticus]
MAHSGALTRGNILYEGNYTKWAKRIQGMLEVHQINTKEHELGYLTAGPEFDDDDYSSHDVRLLVEPQVSTAIMKRVPTAQQDSANKLLKSLYTLARPFRLNDLPPELRKQIYGFHFGHATRYHVKYGPGGKTPTPPPSLLLVSRTIRTEALPLFFNMAEICFSVARTLTLPCQSRAEQNIRAWVRNCAKDNVGMLRHVVLKLGIQGKPPEITITFDLKTGLQVRFSSNILPTQENSWREHIKKLEASREVLRLQGEALILALTSKADFRR